MPERRVITPKDVLPDDRDWVELDGGTVVRKGSVAAFVANARAWEARPDGDPARDELLAAMRNLLPALRAVGVLEVFVPRSERLRDALDLHVEGISSTAPVPDRGR